MRAVRWPEREDGPSRRSASAPAPQPLVAPWLWPWARAVRLPRAMGPERGFIHGAVDPVDVTALLSVPDRLLPASALRAGGGAGAPAYRVCRGCCHWAEGVWRGTGPRGQGVDRKRALNAYGTHCLLPGHPTPQPDFPSPPVLLYGLFKAPFKVRSCGIAPCSAQQQCPTLPRKSQVLPVAPAPTPWPHCSPRHPLLGTGPCSSDPQAPPRPAVPLGSLLAQSLSG